MATCWKSEIAEGVCVGLGIDSGSEDAGVTGEFALSEELPAEEPSERIEPINNASEARGKGCPEVAASMVTDFMEEDGSGRFRVPAQR